MERRPARRTLVFRVPPKTETARVRDTLSPGRPTRTAERGADDDGSQYEDKGLEYSVGGRTCMLMISLGIAGKK